jgi:PAB-dependent poly(A)-specific ribonuclease subunit 3
MPKAIISRSSNTTPFRQDTRTPDWLVSDVPEFVPRRLDGSLQSSEDTTTSQYEVVQPQPQPNPYLDPAVNGATYYQSAPTYQQPVMYHHYAPIGPYASTLLPYQKTVHDLFIPNDLREDIHKRNAAALQTFPNAHLPAQVENYHSLVPLDDTSHKGSGVFGGYTSWVYKVQSSQNGQFYVLRRIEGFRLTNELAIRTVQQWKHVASASIVKVVDYFTNRSFGDSSLCIVTDYHPLSRTVAEQHHTGQYRHLRQRNTSLDQVTEATMWAYITQIASALKTLHSNALAARIVDASKLLVTSKNRVRLNGCAIMDVLNYENQTPLAQLQRQDLINFGLTVLQLGSNMPDAGTNFARAMDQFKRFYKPDLQNAVVWLYSVAQHPDRTIDHFVSNISEQILMAFDGTLHNDDVIHSELSREVENGRLFRLMAKFGFINERPEFDHDQRWSENGERYVLKLFRDYVFHQVDAQGRPVVDLGHVLMCLNKLDAGIDERITLVSRDEQSVFVVSYKELKKGAESAFQELTKGGRRLH